MGEFLIVGVLVLISILGENVVTKAMSFLVFPFIIFLFIFSLLLIPQWNSSLFTNVDFSVISTSNFWVTLWLVIPVMVFSFNHSPIISSLACYCKKNMVIMLNLALEKLFLWQLFLWFLL